VINNKKRTILTRTNLMSNIFLFKGIEFIKEGEYAGK
jgi:hypothetical protein